MKALTIWQPWATLIALGHKRAETRHWPTTYRGPIAIHAAKRKMTSEDLDLLEDFAGWHPHLELSARPDAYPLGCIVATATLTDCLHITHDLCKRQQSLELDVGNWQPGRYAWLLEDVTPLNPPVHAKGRQGLWTWDRAEPSPLFEALV